MTANFYNLCLSHLPDNKLAEVVVTQGISDARVIYNSERPDLARELLELRPSFKLLFRCIAKGEIEEDETIYGFFRDALAREGACSSYQTS